MFVFVFVFVLFVCFVVFFEDGMVIRHYNDIIIYIFT